jgi:putative membrane protein
LQRKTRRAIITLITAGSIIVAAPALGYAQGQASYAQGQPSSAYTHFGATASSPDYAGLSFASPDPSIVVRQDENDNDDGLADNQVSENDNEYDDNEDTADNENANDNFGDFADEASFLRAAVADSATEIEAGRLAQDRAARPELRQLAERVLHDNESAIQTAANVAARNGVATDWQPATDQERQLILDLSARGGDDFDRFYLRSFVIDQQTDISAYRSAKASMRDDVSQYADQHLWMLEDQLRAARDLADMMDVDVD